ncbi:hypothetical protein [Mycobacteroides saopaulense]|uniref:Uncharacterized protein n=1 Tax=Mycobacteroides saopaulense TaxID=1578165 RepID=A0A1S1JMR4_9MYCO|nr:hypothetical protein [Mycobacteroides saopaulense]ALR11137.1 hypothetical protein MYCSP_06285 [Mycobacteroides saopaulense]OHT87036.1 hypothetical protein BKG68_13310 [Mycobacteroides saopaulense]OHU08893.1 hypothetical protein BKG73_18005 [Mycobacteroides saopaulense]ORB59571.1 hypothetical protein BST43_06065 [Mycobacteroides saopaulense]
MVGPVERNVNVVQEVVESVGSRTGRIIRIITRTVGEVAREISGVVADGFEIAEANKRARADHNRWDAQDLAEDVEDEDLADVDEGPEADDDDNNDDEIEAVVEEVTSGSEVDEAHDASQQERV